MASSWQPNTSGFVSQDFRDNNVQVTGKLISGTGASISSSSNVVSIVGPTYSYQPINSGSTIRRTNEGANMFDTLGKSTHSGFFRNGYTVWIENSDPSGDLTITPLLSTINGLSFIILYPGNTTRIVSDGTNYYALITSSNGGVATINGLTGEVSLISGTATSVTTLGQTIAVNNTGVLAIEANTSGTFRAGVINFVNGVNTVVVDNGGGSFQINASGGVAEILAGTGIAVSGATGNVTITNVGVTAVEANTSGNLRTGTINFINGVNTTVVDNGSGVFQINADAGAGGVSSINTTATGGVTINSSTGISVGTVLSTVTIGNTGVLSNVAGTGISVSGPTGNVTISNAGVLSNVAGTGISVSSATGNVTVSNTGVTAVEANTSGTLHTGIINFVAGTNTTVQDNGGGSFQINASGGVSSTIAGLGISVSSATGDVTIGNTGVLSNIAGTGISVSGATGNVTLTNTGVTSVEANTSGTLRTGTINFVAGTNTTVQDNGGGSFQINVATGGGGVASVIAGTAISVSSATGNVTVSNTGVTAVEANTSGTLRTGTINFINGTNTTVVDNGGGSFQINVTTGAGGVASAIAGSGISVSSATGNVTIGNTGVLSNVAGTGISVSSATGNVTVSNTGVTAVEANTSGTLHTGTINFVAGTNTTVVDNGGGSFQINASSGGVTSFNSNTGAITLISGTNTTIVNNGGGSFQTNVNTGNSVTTVSGNLEINSPVNSETATTSYTYLTGDRGKTVNRSNSGTTMTDTLPQAGSTGFPAGWTTYIENSDTTASIILTPTTSTINALTIVYIQPLSTMRVVSDGTNYFAFIAIGTPFSGTLLGPNTSVLTLQSAANGTTAQTIVIQTPTVGTGTGGANETTRMTFNTSAAQGSAGIALNETLYFTANTTGYTYASQAAIGADASAGNLIINSPTAKLIKNQVNGLNVLTVTGVASSVNYINVTAAITGAGPIIASTGSDTNVGVNINTKGTGSVSLNPGSLSGLVVNGVASAVNYITVTPAASGGTPLIAATGSNTSVGLNLQTKGGGEFTTSTGSNTTFAVFSGTSTVNYFSVTASNSGSAVSVATVGSDNSIPLIIFTKSLSGIAPISLQPGGAGNNALVLTANNNSAVNYFQMSGESTTGTPALLATGSDTNVSMSINTKGTGSIIFDTGSTLRVTILNGIQVGAPTGGDEGTGTINMASSLYVNGTTVTDTNGHLVSSSATPGIAAGSGAGTGPTVSVVGTDDAATISITTGTLPTASGILATITFATAFSSAPVVTLIPNNYNSFTLQTVAVTFVTWSTTITTLVLTAGSTALGAGTTFTWQYHAIH